MIAACSGETRRSPPENTAAACVTSDECPLGTLCREGACVTQTGCEGAGTCGDGDSGGDTGGDPSGDSAGDSSGDSGGDTQTGDGDSTSQQVVRFVAIGDTGTGSALQYKVGQSIADHCEEAGCDFMILLGDNFYPTGVSSVDDPQWQTKFELPYAPIDFPIYAALGNHDCGGDGAGTEPWKGSVQVDYAAQSTKFRMPSEYYSFTTQHVGFVVLDTNSIFLNLSAGDDQRDWYTSTVAQLATDWVIVAGHHPYRSNGPHGNAGNYDNAGFIPIVNGEKVKDFFDEVVCGTNHVYLCGHDHSMQWLSEKHCGAELIVSGAGAKTTEVTDRNPYHYQTDKEGFAYIIIEGNRFTAEFYDEDGLLKYERSFTK